MFNTPEHWDLTATITDVERAAFWEAALGTDTVPIVSPAPVVARVPERGIVAVYLLDVRVLSTQQLNSLAQHLTKRFDLVEQATLDELRAGVPILAVDVIVTMSGRAVQL